MARVPLPEATVVSRLASVPGWALSEGCLYRRFEFADFVTAFAFMTQAAFAAEKRNHHPDWRNVYRTVEVRLSTHDAGGITDLDFALAADLNALATR